MPAGTLLEGAIFEIYDRAGNLVDTIRSDSRGLAVSKPLPLSRYTIREVKAPANYGVNETELTAYLEHEGQIVKFEVTNKSLTTGVSITKTGPKEIMGGQPVRYTFSGIANTSNVRLDSFYWRDTIPAQVRLDTVITGTYNFPGTYKITYRVNGGEYRTLADNLSTSKNYILAASAAALGLATNERVTEVMFVFGQAPAGFAQVGPEDTVVLCGDLSWGMSLEEAKKDFAFLDVLPGARKLLLKGNHDYWWNTAAKMERFFREHELTTMEILHNNCKFYGELALCGTRGWFYELDNQGTHNEKVLLHDGETFEIDGIKIECFLVPGHTWGHMVYLIDDKYLFTGDTIWFGADGGYSFISSLAESNKLAVKSLAALEQKLQSRDLHPLFLTGHTGWTDDFEFAFAHKDKLCSPFKKRVPDPTAPYDAYDESDDTEEVARAGYLQAVGR